MTELGDILDEGGNTIGHLHERNKPMCKGEYHLTLYVRIKNDISTVTLVRIAEFRKEP